MNIYGIYYTASGKWRDKHDSPHELISLLLSTTHTLSNNYKDLSDTHFDTLCTTDGLFRKNIELDIKDICLLTTKLQSILKSRHSGLVTES